ncbi:hypothetical protein RU820_05335 [Acidithiobacillus ferrooxidans]|uniref:Uncharacterized protein n=1 Tax=Acidithiobacillus ferrooxidans (strain ATCC 23270 / DSM 14882 / CIP 104768 / NCIMB 8455) TaxID=243159 RepID=B7J869_ACIF2|nr:hypothetical protein [Acidithiobacillus ferrooxidans]ACK80782.1 hypothetical protein AFE_1121 [Acidithiobacillus ferrooxidans ATCC 23270]
MTEFTVKEENGCTFVFGAMSIQMLVRITGKDAKGKVMDTDLARMAGANFAWGNPEDLQRAKPEYRQLAMDRVKSNPVAGKLRDAEIEWLAVGEQGRSSQAIFWKVRADLMFPDGKRPEDTAYPLDPSDLGRCRKLLEQVPSVNEKFVQVMGTMAGPVWAGLVENWECLCATMDREAPTWREGVGMAEETYRLMQEIIAEAEK